MAKAPLCFILMPFGKKRVGGDEPIDFDEVYNQIIRPAVIDAGLEPLRADEEQGGGIIHKPMFERLVLCEYAVADLTAANANVFYELGVRHAIKPHTTVLLFADGHGRLPFDVAQLRALPYSIGANGRPSSIEPTKTALSAKLKQSKIAAEKDSPIYQLLDDWPNVSHEKTDVFRDRVQYAADVKNQLFMARKAGRLDIKRIESELQTLSDVEAGVVLDLMLSYRAVEAWADMIRIAEAMNQVIKNTVIVREQLAFALNRAGRGDEAETVLLQLIKERGASSETLGLLGRVYKERWQNAIKSGNDPFARGTLRKAIETYRKGFEADWRDAYPGINALTCMQLLSSDHPDYPILRPVVEYAVRRKMASSAPDYWDFATLLELAVLDGNADAASKALEDALSVLREVWEARTTLNNLRLLRINRGDLHPTASWVIAIESHLEGFIKSKATN